MEDIAEYASPKSLKPLQYYIRMEDIAIFIINITKGTGPWGEGRCVHPCRYWHRKTRKKKVRDVQFESAPNMDFRILLITFAIFTGRQICLAENDRMDA
eukprot:4326025-Pyramimonas_sp.AAC.1